MINKKGLNLFYFGYYIKYYNGKAFLEVTRIQDNIYYNYRGNEVLRDVTWNDFVCVSVANKLKQIVY